MEFIHTEIMNDLNLFQIDNKIMIYVQDTLLL